MSSVDELRQLAISMRHFGEMFMVTGYDGRKVADLIETALATNSEPLPDLEALALRKYGDSGLYAPHREAFVEGARAAIAARQGWKLVPAEVLNAARRMKDHNYRGPLAWARLIIDWVAASPAAPTRSRSEHR